MSNENAIVPDTERARVDQHAWRAHVTLLAAQHEDERQRKAQAIITTGDVGARYFWPEQTPAEVQSMKQFLVDGGLAEWVIRRDR